MRLSFTPPPPSPSDGDACHEAPICMIAWMALFVWWLRENAENAWLGGGVIGVADYAITPKNPANDAITPTADYAITPLRQNIQVITP